MKHTMCTVWGHAGCKGGRVKSYTVLQNVKSPIGQVVLYANEVVRQILNLSAIFFSSTGGRKGTKARPKITYLRIPCAVITVHIQL